MMRAANDRHSRRGGTVERLKLDLDPAEYTALSRLAERDLRPVPQQARHLVREALRGAGLLGTAADDRSATPTISREPEAVAR